MSDESALIPIDQREIEFYEDELTAVLVQEGGRGRVYIPLRRLCDLIGVSYQGQIRRINDDPVLSDVVKGVNVTFTPSESGRGGGQQATNCIPLEFLNGWLFGINASRVKDEVRDRLIRYQRECYQVLADAFLGPQETAVTPTGVALVQLREMALAIVQTTEELIRLERRQTAVEERVEQAAQWAGQVSKRLSAVERRIKAGPLTEEQAAEIKKRVNQIAQALTEQDPSKSHFQSVYAALQDEAGVTSYKSIPPTAYETAVEWLDAWIVALQKGE